MYNSKCVVCGDTALVLPHESACATCKTKYPAPLITACYDQAWTYALGLRSGMTFVFSGASIVGDWVYLQPDNTFVPGQIVPGLDLERRCGVAVRAEDIMWVLEGGQ